MKEESDFLKDFDDAASMQMETETIKPRCAMEVDDWGFRRGTQLLEESERLQALDIPKEGIVDFHAAVFEPDPKLNASCVDESRLKFLQQLMETNEFQSLHASTQMQPCASEVGATALAEQFVAQSQKSSSEDKDHNEFTNLRAIGKALEQAREEVELAHESAAALGFGTGQPGSNDAKRIGAIYKRVRSSKILHKICNLAGKFRRLAQAKQRQKTKQGFDELVGMKADNDLGRMLPQELAALLDPVLEQNVLRRFFEKELWCREFQSFEPVGKGPLICVVDESGSLEGDRNHAAKALALALAWIARQQKRWCALIAYSGDSGERILPLPLGQWDEVALMDWLEAYIGMGSDLDVPVREMPMFYESLNAPKGKTDLIFITDGACSIPAKLAKTFNDWKRSVHAKLITLVIDNEPNDLGKISDEVHRIRSVHVSEYGIERILSL
ncbi:MAG: hypothetical protein RL179_1247 [Planctomycetota bacterium]|jgi:uncharacterized protein with von Willebrand factor type A (vWA) domain